MTLVLLYFNITLNDLFIIYKIYNIIYIIKKNSFIYTIIKLIFTFLYNNNNK